MTSDIRAAVEAGRAHLGIELGSTRIKAVLTGPDHAPIAMGSHDWENQLSDRVWTYPLDAVWSGLQDCYAALTDDLRHHHGAELTTVSALGISAMMHGYLAFDAAENLLTPFRTWRNTNTGEAAERLSAELGHNIAHRWSVAHLYQAILDGEPHVGGVQHLTTLAGYVHRQLSGTTVLGIGDASGMFPIDPTTKTYDATMLASFDRLASRAGTDLHLVDLLPDVLQAGEHAGQLTAAGAIRLDPTGRLLPGAPMCPPEGDAGTGMVATNSIAPRTGNISAGTSIFAMVVLERPLSRPHREIDMVTTPAGDPVAMVHCNNGASEIGAWVGLFSEVLDAFGIEVTPSEVFSTLFQAALDAAPDGGGLLAYNYLSGEPITDLEEGRPLFVRPPESAFTLANFMRTQLLAALATLRIGMDVLQKDEGMQLDVMLAHGGLFKTPDVTQRVLAAMINTRVSVGEFAAEGGAWGIAVLAGYLAQRQPGQSLREFLATVVFPGTELVTVEPDPVETIGADTFVQRFLINLPVEREAANYL